MAGRLWILGAADPEMEAIETLLRACGERVEHALVRGERVSPAEAYRARLSPSADLRDVAEVYLVECDLVGNEIAHIDSVRRVDHHRPGDPGYGQPPAEFLSASSIGQVIEILAHTRSTSNLMNYDVVLDNAQWTRIEAHTHQDDILVWGCDDERIPKVEVERYSDLGDPLPTVVRLLEQPWPMPFAWVAEIGAYIISTPRGGFELGGSESWHVVPRELVLAAAADHCLAAAYRGECPGVDPDALMRWRVETRAKHQGITVEALLSRINGARLALRDAERVYLGGGQDVADLRAREVPELPEAAVRDGAAYLATVADRDGRRKIVLGGHTSPETVKAFLETWAPSQGLTGLYGDPARGFAGGYLP
mgnify:CR=1 FL=1